MSNYSNRYSYDFKSDAIKLFKEDNRSIPSAAKDLGINPQTLRNWMIEQQHREKPERARISGNIEQNNKRARNITYG